MNRLRTTVVIGLALGCAVGIAPAAAEGADPPSAPAQCPGQSKAPPADWPPPTDQQCGDPKGIYAPPASAGGRGTNQACYEAWVDHCACVNAKQVDAVYNKPNAEKIRRPSPTRGTVPGDATQMNGVHAGQYGIDPNLLKTAPPVRGTPTLKQIGGVNVGNPPGAAGKLQHAPNMYSKTFPDIPGKVPGLATASKLPQLATMKKSTQNTWAAYETLARAEAAYGRCNGKTGADLIACASTFDRPLHGAAPKIGAINNGKAPACEDFVYNRYRDIERWHDHVNACGHDAMCKATMTLDPNFGIAGKLLSGSDVDANHYDVVRKLFILGATGNANAPMPVCDKGNLKGDDLIRCEAARSLPPLAHIVPTYYTPLAGGGQVLKWMTANGVQDVASIAGDPNGLWAAATGYFMAKNPFYDPDAQAVISNMVVQAFSKDPAKYASMQRLAAEMKKGAEYYYVGAPAPKMPAHHYATEWDYDRAMFNAVKNQSEQTFRDYAKRKQHVKKRADTFRQVFDAATAPKISANEPAETGSAKAKAPPAAMKGALLGAANKIAQATANARTRKPASTSAFSPTLQGAVPNARLSERTLAQLGAAIIPLVPTAVENAAWNGGQNPPQIDPSYPYPRLLCPAPDRVSARYTGAVSRAQKGTIDPKQYTDVRSAACDYVNAILDEWARYDNPAALAPPAKAGDPAPGPTGCFANDLACDWDPREFIAGMEDLVKNQITNVESARQEEDLKFCRMFGGVTLADPKYNKNLLATEQTLLTGMKSLVQGSFDAVRDIPALEKGGTTNGKPNGSSKPASSPDDPTAVFGEKRANAETWGNDLFGVGYSFGIGWELPTEWQHDKAKQGYEVCDFGLGAWGEFKAFAYAFGSDKFNIIDAELGAGINDAQNQVVPTDGNTGKYKAYLEIAGDEIVNYQGTIKLNNQETKTLGSGSNSWMLFDIPFQISFVTLEIQVGVGFKYGVDATYGPTHVNDCNKGNHPPHPSIKMNAGIKPYGELDAIVDAYASLAGLAGIGAEVQLTLLGIDLPANASIGIDTNPKKANELDFVVGTDLSMDFHTLDGSLSVYAELLFFKLFDITILHWDGFHKKIPIWNTEARVKIADLGNIGATGLMNPGNMLNEL